MKRITIDAEDEFHRKVKLEAAKKNTSMKELVTRILEKEIKQ